MERKHALRGSDIYIVKFLENLSKGEEEEYMPQHKEAWSEGCIWTWKCRTE